MRAAEWLVSCSVAFIVEGESLVPEDVTLHVGLAPDVLRHVGDNLKPGSPAPLYSKHARWALKSSLDQKVELQDHLAELLERIRPVAARFRHFADSADVVLSIALKYEDGIGDPPLGLSLNPSLLEVLGKAGASIDIDQAVIVDQ